MEQKNNGNLAHKTHELHINCREKGSLNGMEKVISSCDTMLNLVSACGGLVITGENLKILQFNAETGELDFEGNVFSIKYSAPKKPLLKRIFK